MQQIDNELIVNHALCPRKAYFQLSGCPRTQSHEFVSALRQRQLAVKEKLVGDYQREAAKIIPFSFEKLTHEHSLLKDAKLKSDGQSAFCDLLVLSDHKKKNQSIFEPVRVLNTYKIQNEQKAELAYVAHVLESVQGLAAPFGHYVTLDHKRHKTPTSSLRRVLEPTLSALTGWIAERPADPPPLVSRSHCTVCEYRSCCAKLAKEKDELGMLRRMTHKLIERYHRKGIFTVTQLSYLFRPRRRRKRRASTQTPKHSFELQALALRTGTTYVQTGLRFENSLNAIFFDIEGDPNQSLYYLFGALVRLEGQQPEYHSFWADKPEDTASAFAQALALLERYPELPILHYGDFEPRALRLVAKDTKTDAAKIIGRLVNINSLIYGRVYFPVYSNGLKSVARHLGARWTDKNASGVQSLAWRMLWERTRDDSYKRQLLTYNREDCEALAVLADALGLIQEKGDSINSIDFVDNPKQHATELGQEIHQQFSSLLKMAHLNYEHRHIVLRKKNPEDKSIKPPKRRGGARGKRVRKRRGKENSSIRVRRRLKCPRHKIVLQPIEKEAERLVFDLRLTKNGIRKVILRYHGSRTYCRRCMKSFIPPALARVKGAKYGETLKAWVVYSRIVLRLSGETIAAMIEELFDEPFHEPSVPAFVDQLAERYLATEQLLKQRILESPVVHIDETRINIKGVNQYVWVFTDGMHVMFRLTETREAEVAREFLIGYQGTMVTDFYGGYDSIPCRQQKCWSHLIRDFNEDLWKAPFNAEYELFVVAVRDLILPIYETIQRYGLRKRNLNKHRKEVRSFYKEHIDSRTYRTEVTTKYQKRFARYRDSLFTFLEADDIPWNNNMGERALRHLAIQRKISGSFSEHGAKQYLRMLGIAQTCRFQGKSMLRFLQSGQHDIDAFGGRSSHR